MGHTLFYFDTVLKATKPGNHKHPLVFNTYPQNSKLPIIFFSVKKIFQLKTYLYQKSIGCH